MAKYIPLDAVLAEIKRRYKLVDKYETNEFCAVASRYELVHIKNFINTLEVKEVDLKKEYDNEFFKDPVFSKLVNRNAGISIAKHFFELGMRVNNPVTASDRGTAEEIIINLKQVENDYRLDLTKEIE